MATPAAEQERRIQEEAPGVGQQAPAPALPLYGRWKDADELHTSYAELEKKLTQQGQELGDSRRSIEEARTQTAQYHQAVQQWADWYEKILKPHWPRIERALQAETQPAQQPSQTQAAAEFFKDWDLLPAQEQANRLYQAAVTGVVHAAAPALQKWQQDSGKAMQDEFKRWQEHLDGRERYYQNWLNLWRKVWQMKQDDPSMDVDKVLDQAVKVLSNEVDPLEIGRKLAYEGLDRDKLVKEVREQARRDFDQEQKNREVAAVVPSMGSPPAFKVPRAASGGLGSQREAAAKALLEKFGPGVFSGPSG